ALYDTDGLRRITGGERTAGPMNFVPGLETSPGGRWLIEGVGEGEFIVRDPMTGNPTCRIQTPGRDAVVGVAFNRAEDRVVVVTQTTVGPDSTPGATRNKRPLSVWMFNPASGATIWARPDLDDCAPDALRGGAFLGFPGTVPIVWSPDEQRLLIRYQASPTEGRVWVGESANGTTERTLAGPAESRNPTGPRSTFEWVSLDPTGRRVAVSGGKEVWLWDLDTGSLITTVKDFDGMASETEFSTDGTRLFALDRSF